MTALAEDISAPVDDLELSIDHVIAQCDGDARAAVRALIVANGFLERDIEALRAAVSSGFVRGRFDGLIAHGEAMAAGHPGER